MVLPPDVETRDRQICLLAEFGRRQHAPAIYAARRLHADTLALGCNLALPVRVGVVSANGKMARRCGVERLSIGSQASFQGYVCGRIKKGPIRAFG